MKERGGNERRDTKGPEGSLSIDPAMGAPTASVKLGPLRAFEKYWDLEGFAKVEVTEVLVRATSSGSCSPARNYTSLPH